jgi:general L-amino acid transport system substrate-binding protein
MRKRLFAFALVLTALLVSVSLTMAQDATVKVGPITQRILDRGKLICGANKAGLAGFAVVGADGEWSGFDVDICRAVAVAVLGDAKKVEFRPLEANQRQAAIQSEDIDIMSRNTTYTLSREATWGATFAPTTFYDGQGIAVKSSSKITKLEELAGATICVQSGTTTELNLADVFNQRKIEYKSKVFNEAAATWDAFVSGTCDAFTTDKSGIIAYVGSSKNPADFSILADTLSKEPLGPLTPVSDQQFASVVRWTVYGLIQAEELGITSKNVDDKIAEATSKKDAVVLRFLGQGDNATGKLFGIKNDFMVDVIKQVGNYSEIFDRNLGPDTPFKLARGVNALWTQGGLLYAPPFR